jgi:hypothetical protein
MTEPIDSKKEELSEEVHKSWMKEKLDQGFHAPDDCPTNGIEHPHSNLIKIGKFEKHCDKCHPDLYPYSELRDNIKEYDRVTVKTVISAITKIELDVTGLETRKEKMRNIFRNVVKDNPSDIHFTTIARACSLIGIGIDEQKAIEKEVRTRHENTKNITI